MPDRTAYQVFISYHEQDEVAATELARHLHDDYSITLWLRAWSAVPGKLTQKEQEQGLEQSQACAVLIGRAGLDGWQEHHVYAAISKRVETKGSNYPVIPVYLPDCTSEARATVSDELRLYEPVELPALDDAEALRKLICGIRGEPPGPQAPIELQCPFPGLAPFRAAMAPYFFGRHDEIAKLEQMVATNPFVVVIGPSGSGKSSLVLAGLLPQLAGSVTNPSPYLIYTLTPGREPLQRLALLFVPEAGDPRRDPLAQAFLANERELSRTVQGVLNHQPAHVRQLLLVVDQLEELFTQCESQEQRAAFIKNLLYTCTEEKNAKVVFTLRADFYAPCFDYQALVNQQLHLPVQPLRGERLRHMIEESAHAGGLFLQRGLVDTLLEDAGDEAGILPLIQFTLRELFERRNGRWLTFDAYYALGADADTTPGGVRGLIAARAKAAVDALKHNPKFDAKQVDTLVRRIFLRLVQVGENSPPTRQQVARQEFFWASDTPQQQILLAEALDLLIRERLLTSDRDQVNLAHEIIIRSWQPLAKWVDESKEDLLTRRRVEEAAREWARAGRDESLLYRGVQLQKALEWQARRI